MPDRRVKTLLPFARTRLPGRFGRRHGIAGVNVRDASNVEVAAITARRGMARALAEQVRRAFGVDLPQIPLRVGNGALSITWSGPDRWLAIRTGSVPALPALFRDAALARLATIVDQSHGLAILAVSGPRVRETLAKGFSIDLHPRVFRTGHTAMTTVSHIAVQITQIADDPVFEIAIARSFAESFWHWLEASAAEFGLEVQGSGEAPVR